MQVELTYIAFDTECIEVVEASTEAEAKEILLDSIDARDIRTRIIKTVKEVEYELIN